jgi:NAD(P)-dependent dehydrogenase (short-subunit alcohol dehydrogenase family)
MPTRYVLCDELLTNWGDESASGGLSTRLTRCRQKRNLSKHKNSNSRWVRRTAPSWIKNGVTLNAIAPGAVATSILGSPGGVRGDDETMIALPMPMVYWKREVMQTSDLGSVLAFLALPEAKGCIARCFCERAHLRF